MVNRQIRVARGSEPADLVFKHASVVNVFTEQVEVLDVAICQGMIVGLGTYDGLKELDCTGKYLVPGFIDGHIHLESSMMQPAEFARTVLPHGTTTVVTDPHEITNVCGTKGLDYMLTATEGLPLDVYFMLPSCVPSTALDESGAVLEAEDLRPYYKKQRVLGLAEMMNYPGVLNGDPATLAKITEAARHHGILDGHAPGLTGKDLNAYIAAGIQSDHECSNGEEAKERIRRGQWVMVREGTAARNLEALMPMFRHPYSDRTLLVTDDKHPGDLLRLGHIDYILRRAVSLGADPCTAVRMSSLNAARYFKLNRVGAIAPGYIADMVLLEDLEAFHVLATYKAGKLVAEAGKAKDFAEPEISEWLRDSVYHSFHMKKYDKEDFHIFHEEAENKIRVISLIEGEILTEEAIMDYVQGHNGIVLDQDILKLAVMERHHHTGHVGLAYIKGYGLKKGAIASSVAHDSHNLLIVGTNETDMCVAAKCVEEMQGGWAVVADGKVVEKLPLPVAGLMSDLSAHELAERIGKMKAAATTLGVQPGIDPFMTLAFMSLPVIPKIKLTTLGLVDVETQKIVKTGAIIS